MLTTSTRARYYVIMATTYSPDYIYNLVCDDCETIHAGRCLHLNEYAQHMFEVVCGEYIERVTDDMLPSNNLMHSVPDIAGKF